MCFFFATYRYFWMTIATMAESGHRGYRTDMALWTTRRAAAAALGGCLALAAVLAVVRRDGIAGSSAAPRTALAERGIGGEDGALRALYDVDGERVPGAVIAAEAEADADLPETAAGAVRTARQNLAAVEEAATSAEILSKKSSKGLEAWEAKLGKAMQQARATSGPAGHATTAHSAAPSVRAQYEVADRREQTKDSLKEEMAKLLRRKLSAVRLDMHHKLRKEKEAEKRRARRQARAMHEEVRKLKLKLLHQHERMETKMIKLQTKEHHYRDEKAITTAQGQGAALQPAQASASSSREATGDDDDDDDDARGERTAEEAQTKALGAQVGRLRAELAELEKSLKRNDDEAHASGNPQLEKQDRAIARIEQGLFKHQLSAHDARAKIADMVVRDQAGSAAPAKRLELGRSLVAKPAAVVTPTAPPLQTPPALAVAAARAVSPPPASAARARPAPVVPAATEAVPAPHPGAPGGTAAAADVSTDAALKQELREAIAQKNAAEAEAEGFLLEAKNREIAVLEKQVALGQRLRSLRQMQEEAADRGLMPPVDEQAMAPLQQAMAPLQAPDGDAFGGESELSWPAVASEDDGQRDERVQDEGEEEQDYRIPQDSATAAGVADGTEEREGAQAARAPPRPSADAPSGPRAQTAVADVLDRPAVAWDPRGLASGLSFRDRFERLPRRRAAAAGGSDERARAPPPALEAAAPDAARAPPRVSLGGWVGAGAAVDRVPEWSPRVKALQDRALRAGYRLVPASEDTEAAAEASSVSHEDGGRRTEPRALQEDTSTRSAPATSRAAAGRVLAAPPAAAAAGERDDAGAAGMETRVKRGEDAAALRERRLWQQALAAAPARAGGSGPDASRDASHDGGRGGAAPEGLEGASVLDSIGRVFFTTAKKVFQAL